ncbi:hypothetical protein GCM10028805_47330 [Spirosoma harenae]
MKPNQPTFSAETSHFHLEELFDESGQKVGNRWTITLTDWMAYYFQTYVFPINQVDYLSGRIE